MEHEVAAETRWWLEETRVAAVEATTRRRDFVRWDDWLPEYLSDERLPEVSVLERARITACEFSLTPGRCADVPPKEENEDFDLEAALRPVHIDFKELNDKAEELIIRIDKNLKRPRP